MQIMSTLVLEELKASTLEQELTVNKRSVLRAIRPNLYFHNDPAGTYTIKIKNGSTELASKSLTMAEIISGASWTTGQYHHGVITFDLSGSEIVLNKGVTYTIELSASGYSFSESSYVGWIKEYENLKNTYTGSTSDAFSLPFSYEIWSYL